MHTSFLIISNCLLYYNIHSSHTEPDPRSTDVTKKPLDFCDAESSPQYFIQYQKVHVDIQYRGIVWFATRPGEITDVIFAVKCKNKQTSKQKN